MSINCMEAAEAQFKTALTVWFLIYLYGVLIDMASIMSSAVLVMHLFK